VVPLSESPIAAAQRGASTTRIGERATVWTPHRIQIFAGVLRDLCRGTASCGDGPELAVIRVVPARECDRLAVGRPCRGKLTGDKRVRRKAARFAIGQIHQPKLVDSLKDKLLAVR